MRRHCFADLSSLSEGRFLEIDKLELLEMTINSPDLLAFLFSSLLFIPEEIFYDFNELNRET